MRFVICNSVGDRAAEHVKRILFGVFDLQDAKSFRDVIGDQLLIGRGLDLSIQSAITAVGFTSGMPVTSSCWPAACITHGASGPALPPAPVSVQALLGRHLSKIPDENTPGQEFDVIRSLCRPKAFPAAFDVNSEISQLPARPAQWT